MSTNYARGQETFTHKVSNTVRNFFSLVFFSSILALVSFGVLIYWRMPIAFWISEKVYFQEAFRHIKRQGPFAVGEATDYTVRATRYNVAHHWEYIASSFSWATFIAAIAGAGFFIYFILRGRDMKSPDLKRGSQLISPKAFNREYRALVKREVREVNRDNGIFNWRKRSRFAEFWGSSFVCSADKIKIPSYALHRHCAFVGTTGVGKSTLIKWYLEYARANGEKVIIPDINGEYAAEFYRPGDIILSLFDPNTSYWDFKSEAIDPSEFAKFLVPTGDDHNKFWWKGARQVVGQLLEIYKDPSELWAKINSNDTDITANLNGLAKKVAGKEGTAQAAGITGSSILDFGFLRYLNRWPESKGDTAPVSIYDWTQNDRPNWIFITFSDTDKEIVGPLFKLWINTAITGLLRRVGKHVPLNIVIDELATIGKIELLPTALERSRKYGGRIMLGYQSESQLVDTYGRESAGSLKANTGTKFIFRCPEPREAKELSDYLGRQEVTEKSLATSYGSKVAGGRENISEREAIRNVVLDSEIRDLPDGHFYLKSLSIDPTRSRVKKKRWDRVYLPQFRYPAARDGLMISSRTTSTTNQEHQEAVGFEPDNEPEPSI